MKSVLLTLTLVFASFAGAAEPALLKPCPRCQEMADLIQSNDLEKEQTYVNQFNLASDPDVASQEAFAYTLVALHYMNKDLAGEENSSAYYDIYNKNKDVMSSALQRLRPKDQAILKKALSDYAKYKAHGNS